MNLSGDTSGIILEFFGLLLGDKVVGVASPDSVWSENLPAWLVSAVLVAPTSLVGGLELAGSKLIDVVKSMASLPLSLSNLASFFAAYESRESEIV